MDRRRRGPTRPRWRIAIVEDHLLQRLRTEELLRSQPSFEVPFSGETLPELLGWLDAEGSHQRLHLVVLDLVVDRGPSVDPDAVGLLVRSGTSVLVLSALTSPQLVREVLRAGAIGVVSKRDSEADVLAAVWSALGRHRWFTPELTAVLKPRALQPRLSEQEERALVLYASGHTLDGVAKELGVRPDTAKTYLSRVKQKYARLGRPVRSKVELAQAALQDGFLDPPPDLSPARGTNGPPVA